MRDSKDIQQQIIDTLAKNNIVVSSNKFSRRRMWTFVVAFCIWIHESLWELFKKEIDDTIANDRPHTPKWYENIVGDFQYGYTVNPTTLKYDNTGISNSVIEASKIVAYRAVTEEGDSLNIKVAKDNGTDLEPLSTPELDALKDYMENSVYGQKDAGVFLTFINTNADNLKLEVDVYFHPALINNTGVEISSGKQTVKLSVAAYLKQMQFNGVFALQDLQDKMQLVAGVKYIKFKKVEVKPDSSSDWETVDVFYLPTSGYLRIINDADLTLNFIVFE